MEIKKYPDAVLENYSLILVELGLVLALFIVYEFIQMKSYPRPVEALSAIVLNEDDAEELIEIKPVEVEPAPIPNVAIAENIVKVDDEVEIEETLIESTETDESEAVEDLGHLIKIVTGSKSNIKITQKDDLELANYYLK